jgi:hypothetical protein
MRAMPRPGPALRLIDGGRRALVAGVAQSRQAPGGIAVPEQEPTMTTPAHPDPVQAALFAELETIGDRLHNGEIKEAEAKALSDDVIARMEQRVNENAYVHAESGLRDLQQRHRNRRLAIAVLALLVLGWITLRAFG